MKARTSLVWLSVAVLALASVAAGEAGRPEVEIVLPVARDVTDYEDFLGRTEPSASVHLRSRVSGHLVRVLFKDGADVKQGDLLFETDPRQYKAALDRADAGLALAEVRFKRADAAYVRGKALADRKVLGRDELDRLAAEREETQARIRLAKAQRDVAALELSFTRIAAPISGRVGRRLLDVGGLVKADETDLVTLTSHGPMYVHFTIDERTALRLLREKVQGLRVAMGLADEQGFPREGVVDYVARHVDPGTGTLGLRTSLPNPDGHLMSGLSVRVRLMTGKPYKAQMVPVAAVQPGRGMTGKGAPGPGKPFVLILDEKDQVEAREVQLGSRHGPLVAVREGLKATDRVVIAGRHRLKAGVRVKPKVVEIPGEVK